MRVVRIISCLFLLSVSAFAADLRIRVVDPQGAAVTGARVAVFSQDRAVAVHTTGPDGATAFDLPPANYRVEVLSRGFAPSSQTVTIPTSGEVTTKLALAGAAATVNVTADRTPVTTEQTSSNIAALDEQALTAMQPTAAGEALRFLPGAIVTDAGQRGGQTSLFVRGGESRYNKVIVDDVPVNDPGGTFDFGMIPMTSTERVEFVRGAESTLYGSDAMTSVVQFFSRTGTSHTPELLLGAEGGTFATARGYGSLAGANGRFDYNLFGEQFNTDGQYQNSDYSNSSAGANLGVAITPHAFFRLRSRYNNSRVGVPGEFIFNGQQLLPPDSDTRARQRNFLSSAELTFSTGKIQHRVVGFEYNHRRNVVDTFQDPGRVSPAFGNFDFPFSDFANINRAGFDYQGEWWQRTWSRSSFGYQFEDENGFVGDLTVPPLSHGLRRNHAVFGQQVLTWKRATVIAGVRHVHNESFGNRAIPRAALSYLLWNGNSVFSGTRLRGSYSEGIKEPRLEESFGIGGYGIVPNPNLKAEQNRAFEAGLQQNLFGNRYVVSATYFNNLFRNRIDFSFDPATFTGQYVNVNKAMAHGAEIELQGRPTDRLQVQGAYVYTSTQILQAPFAFDPLLSAGAPLLRRPKHSGNFLVSYARSRFGGSLGGTFIGRRTDSDFFGFVPPITHVNGYARMDVGAWYAVHPRVTAYVNVENFTNQHYEDAVGYPALKANFRAGLRFRLGGE